MTPSSDAPPNSQNLHSDLILPNAGIPGPIPEDFDFDGRISLPDGITCFELPLAVCICKNVNIEEFNNTSILKTIAVKNTPVLRPNDLDIGRPLKPLYYYADDEVRDLTDSKALCALFAPLPATLLQEIVSGCAHLKQANDSDRHPSQNKDKEDNGSIRSKLLGR
ncbi:hypothetical protein C0993_010480 [Termitomyces sp. T159_Od127]|nr:hypothetical protein C0993_010480 [Termitomyces sp. T159_Od127]